MVNMPRLSAVAMHGLNNGRIRTSMGLALPDEPYMLHTPSCDANRSTTSHWYAH